MPITNFDKVELLLPMTGDNNGTVFTDYSLRQRAVTRVNSPVTSTAQSKFAAYGSSGSFPGTTVDHLILPNTFGHLFGSNDFCIEGYFRPGTLSASRSLFAQRTSGTSNHAMSCFVTDAGKLQFFTGAAAGTTSTTIAESGNAAMVADSWQHFAAARDGNTLRMFVNGSSVASGSLSHAIHQSSQVFRIGATNDPALAQWVGFMQDFCVTIGQAKYTANFTPPDRMTQRTLTRANTGTDSHEYDRAVLFDFNGGAHVGRHTTVVPDSEGDFVADDLIDLEYGVAFIKDDCGPICRGPVEVDPDA
jgi:hypothetical protein